MYQYCSSTYIGVLFNANAFLNMHVVLSVGESNKWLEAKLIIYLGCLICVVIQSTLWTFIINKYVFFFKCEKYQIIF